MEPCLFRHGKDAEPGRQYTAVVMLQWSHVFSDMVSRDLVVGERHVLMLQWSHVFSDMVRRNPGTVSGDPGSASMEPCLFRHGKSLL